MGKKVGIILVLLSLCFSLSLYSDEINLLDRVSKAKWINSQKKFLKFGVDGEKIGTVKFLYNVTLEDNKKHKRVLQAHPDWIQHGLILGVIEDVKIPQQNPKLIISGGFVKGAQDSDGVRFSVNFVAASSAEAKKMRLDILASMKETGIRDREPGTGKSKLSLLGKQLCSFTAKYDGKIDKVEGELGELKGQTGDLYLILEAGNTSKSDWVAWTQAKIIYGKPTKPEKPERPEKKEEPKAKKVKTLRGHSNRIYRIDISPNGKFLVTASGDKTAKVWGIPQGNTVTALRGHSAHVFWTGFSSNNRQVVTAGDNTARVWDSQSGRQIRLLAGHKDRVLSAVFSPDGRYIATTCNDGTAKIWDSRSGQELYTLAVSKGGVFSACFSPNSRKLAIGSYVGEVSFWNPSNGKKINGFKAHSRAVQTINYSPNGRYIVTASVDNTAKIWDSGGGTMKKTFKGNSFYAARFSHDNKFVITGNDGGATIWKVSDGKKVVTLKHPSAVRTVSFGSKGKYAVTAGEDQTTIIWKLNIN